MVEKARDGAERLGHGSDEVVDVAGVVNIDEVDGDVSVVLELLHIESDRGAATLSLCNHSCDIGGVVSDICGEQVVGVHRGSVSLDAIRC